MRNIKNIALFALIPLMLTACSARAQKPNIVFIFSDDHRYDLLGTVNPGIRTPNMDTIAESGVYFTNSFVTTAICSPSRASTMTGHYGSINGVEALDEYIDSDELSFADHLSGAGYRSVIIGKWHVKNSPADMGFDQWAYFKSNGSWFNRTIYTNIPGVPTRTGGQFIEAFNADRAINYIDDHVANHDSEPFVMWLCNQIPHVDGGLKYAVHKEGTDGPGLFAQYNAADMPVPGNWIDDLANKPPYLQTSVSLTKSATQNYGGPGGYTNLAPGVRNTYLGQDNVQNHNREYYASISWWDQEMGRVLDRLKDPNGDGNPSDSIMDNTWIIFMGDNGWFTGHHKFTSKVLTYEESMRVPMFVRPPLKKDGTPSVPPRMEDNLVMNVDLTALILDIAGVSIPEDTHGMNLNTLINDKNATWRDRVYYEVPQAELGGHIHESVRTHSYKYIRTYTDRIGGTLDFEELYGLRTDSVEMANVVNAPDYADIKKIMQDLIKIERQKIDATDASAEPTENMDFEATPFDAAWNNTCAVQTAGIAPGSSQAALLQGGTGRINRGWANGLTDFTLDMTIKPMNAGDRSFNLTMFKNGADGSSTTGVFWNMKIADTGKLQIYNNVSTYGSTKTWYPVDNSFTFASGSVYRIRVAVHSFTEAGGTYDVSWSDAAETTLTHHVTGLQWVQANSGPVTGIAFVRGNSAFGEFTVDDIVFDPPPSDHSSPAAPSAILKTEMDSSVILDWPDNAEPDVGGYVVYRSTTTGNDYEVVASVSTGVTASTYTDTNVTKGEVYFYRVTAVDEHYNESLMSDEVSAVAHVAGDLTRNGRVDLQDTAELASGWLETVGYDFNDLLDIVANWLDGAI